MIQPETRKHVHFIARVLVFGLAPLLLVGGRARADLSEPETLRGLDGVMVIVERLHPDAQRIGLDKETLDAEVRSRLQDAGIPILSSKQRMENERRPYLYVNCNIMYLQRIDLVSFSLDIELHQRVTLAGGEKAQGLTWAKSYLSVQNADQASAQIRHVLAGYVEQFIAAYQEANRPAGNDAPEATRADD